MLAGQESRHNHCPQRASQPSCSVLPLAAWRCVVLHGSTWCSLAPSLFAYRTAECGLDWINLLASMAFHLSLDGDYNTAELLWWSDGKVSLDIDSDRNTGFRTWYALALDWRHPPQMCGFGGQLLLVVVLSPDVITTLSSDDIQLTPLPFIWSNNGMAAFFLAQV